MFRKDFVRKDKFVTKCEQFRTWNEWVLSQNARCSRYETEELVAKCGQIRKRMTLSQIGTDLPLIILNSLLGVHKNLQPMSHRKIVSCSIILTARFKFWQQLPTKFAIFKRVEDVKYLWKRIADEE
jgi:hypothetical protein